VHELVAANRDGHVRDAQARSSRRRPDRRAPDPRASPASPIETAPARHAATRCPVLAEQQYCVNRLQSKPFGRRCAERDDTVRLAARARFPPERSRRRDACPERPDAGRIGGDAGSVGGRAWRPSFGPADGLSGMGNGFRDCAARRTGYRPADRASIPMRSGARKRRIGPCSAVCYRRNVSCTTEALTDTLQGVCGGQSLDTSATVGHHSITWPGMDPG